MKNFNQDIKIQFQEKAFRFTTRLLSFVIIGIVVGALVLRILGISTDNIGW
jgi:hypothetical protein